MSFSVKDHVRATLQHLADLVASSQASYRLASRRVERKLLRTEMEAAADVRATLLSDIETVLGEQSSHASIGPPLEDVFAYVARCERTDNRVNDALEALSQMVVPLAVDELLRRVRERLDRSTRRFQACLRLLRMKKEEPPVQERGVVLLAGFDEARMMELASELAERGIDAEIAAGVGEAMVRALWDSPLAVAVPEGADAQIGEAVESSDHMPLVMGVANEADAATVVQKMFEDTRFSAGAPNVLVVEDDADLRSALSLALSERGFVVEEAIDGLDALGKVKDNSVVLLDLMMPRMSGVNFLKEIAKTKSPPRVVVYSAYVEPAAAKFSNVTAVLRKTAGIDAVVDALRSSLS